MAPIDRREASRRVSLPLGEFGRRSVETGARRERLTVDDLLRAAIRYLLETPESIAAARVPRFVRESPEPEARLDLTLTLEAADWRALEQRAERERVTLERLVAHAVLFYLAELDAGRVAERVAERLEDED